ncbi:MAG: DNA repair protein RecO [Devosiaceae bacterium]|nr:DNA repair protein RecO [Devosiaceae bacterium]
MQWTGEGLIIGIRRHGESSVIVEAMTVEHGRHLGLVRGGRSKKQSGTLQVGNSVCLTWRARLSEHLGAFTAELTSGRAADMIANRQSLYVSQTVCAHLRLLAERDPHPRLLRFALEILDADVPLGEHLQMLALFELTLLDELGFGLDVSSCALTGETAGLTHVSPKTGRAVTRAAAGKYLNKLFVLPAFFKTPQNASDDEILSALNLTGHFLQRHIWDVRKNSHPLQRDQLLTQLQTQL